MVPNLSAGAVGVFLTVLVCCDDPAMLATVDADATPSRSDAGVIDSYSGGMAFDASLDAKDDHDGKMDGGYRLSYECRNVAPLMLSTTPTTLEIQIDDLSTGLSAFSDGFVGYMYGSEIDLSDQVRLRTWPENEEVLADFTSRYFEDKKRAIL